MGLTASVARRPLLGDVVPARINSDIQRGPLFVCMVLARPIQPGISLCIQLVLLVVIDESRWSMLFCVGASLYIGPQIK
jgi:hypothetical protein